MILLPTLALADPAGAADDDPFDRPGFYVGVGASYQVNLFESTIDDEIQDELQDTVPDAQFDIQDSFGVNAKVGYRVASFFAAEIAYEWIDEYAIQGSSQSFGDSGDLYRIEGHTLTLNTKWIVPFWRIQPYVLVGGGLAISDVDRGDLYDGPLGPVLVDEGADVRSGRHTAAAGRAGLGLDLYVTEHILVNVEGGVVLTTFDTPDLDDIDDLNYVSFSAGLQYRF